MTIYIKIKTKSTPLSIEPLQGIRYNPIILCIANGFQKEDCMASKNTAPETSAATALPKKLWIYTNYDCNLSCSYCVAESTPRAARRAIGLETVKKLVDEARGLGFEQVYFTGGEPFILDEIYEMLAYSAAHVTTTALTNAALLRGSRLEKLNAICNPNIVVQVSLDGSCPAQHDPYRGAGSWMRTIEGLDHLQASGFKLRLSTTETPANREHLGEICAFHTQRGIPEEDHFVRPLAKRGFSQEGMGVNKETLTPELTVNAEGIYWHPLSTDPDLLVTGKIFPLANAVKLAQAELDAIQTANQAKMQTFQ
jgi:sulfatase maturation enzyme AslB (radical SAM superfamily)